jgi:hypothetical protein
MLQDFINAMNESNGPKFVGFTYTNKFGETASRVIQINTSYKNALNKDLEIVANVEFPTQDEFSHETFVIAKAELIKSIKLSLGKIDNTMTAKEIEKHSNRSKGQTEGYIQIAKNVRYNIEQGNIHFFAKEVSKKVLVEGEYPQKNKREKTKAKDYIKKYMKSSKYRTFIIPNIETMRVNGETLEF